MQDNHDGVLLEDIDNKLDALIEVVSSMNNRLIGVEDTMSAIPEIQSDIKTIKAVQVDQGRDIRHIEKYLTAQGMPQRA